MESFRDYCVNYAIENIGKHIEAEFSTGEDLGKVIMKDANETDVITSSEEKAKEYLIGWWKECGNYLNYERDVAKYGLLNPFDSPESFMIFMVTDGICDLLDQCKSARVKKSTVLTQARADNIIYELRTADYKIRWEEKIMEAIQLINSIRDLIDDFISPSSKIHSFDDLVNEFSRLLEGTTLTMYNELGSKLSYCIKNYHDGNYESWTEFVDEIQDLID